MTLNKIFIPTRHRLIAAAPKHVYTHSKTDKSHENKNRAKKNNSYSPRLFCKLPRSIVKNP